MMHVYKNLNKKYLKKIVYSILILWLYLDCRKKNIKNKTVLSEPNKETVDL